MKLHYLAGAVVDRVAPLAFGEVQPSQAHKLVLFGTHQTDSFLKLPHPRGNRPTFGVRRCDVAALSFHAL